MGTPTRQRARTQCCCCAAATSAPALPPSCRERSALRACLFRFASSAAPFLRRLPPHAGVCVAAVPRGARRAPLRASPLPAAPLRRLCFRVRRCALPGGHPARSGQRRGGLRRAERRPDVLAGRRGPHRPGALQPRALMHVASLTAAAPRRCRGRTGCVTRLAWLTRPTGAASCAPRRRWTGARNARPCRDAPSPPRPPDPAPRRYLERMSAAVADARAASGQRRVSLLVRRGRTLSCAACSPAHTHSAGAQRRRLARARVAPQERCVLRLIASRGASCSL